MSRVQQLLPGFLLALLSPLLLHTTVAAASEDYSLIPLEEIGEFTLSMASGDEADVYFPDTATGERYPAVAFLQGALVDKQFYSEFGRRVAQHGFVVFIPNHFQELFPGQPPMLFTELRVITEVQEQAAIEDSDSSSPLFGRVDTTRLGVSGHSFGGAAALFGIEETCSPPFCYTTFERPDELLGAALFGANSATGPIIQDIDSSAVPTGLVQGARDGAAEPFDGLGTYEILEAPKALIGLRGVNHFGITDVDNPPGANPDPNAPGIEQELSYSRAALWVGIFLRAYLYDDSQALELIFESGGVPAGDVLILSETGAR